MELYDTIQVKHFNQLHHDNLFIPFRSLNGELRVKGWVRVSNNSYKWFPNKKQAEQG